MAEAAPSVPGTQPAAAAHDPHTYLLDLPDALLVQLLSSAHCSSSTSRSAATTCRSLRHAALSSVTIIHADLASAAPAQVFAFARSLPALRRMHLNLDTDLDISELHALASVTRLHELELEGPMLEIRTADADLSALAALTSLRRLRLVDCGVSDSTVMRIVPALPHLHTLGLERNRVTGAAISTLAAASLQSLNLSRNSVDGEGEYAQRHAGRLALSPSAAALTALTYLNLYRCRVGDEGASVLARLTSLRCLNLFGCEVGPDCVAALTSLSALTCLDLQNNALGREGARSVATLTALASLAVSGDTWDNGGYRF